MFLSVARILFFLILCGVSCKVTRYDHAFISDRDGTLDLYLSIAGRPPFNVTNDKFVDDGLEWSPDGKSVLFARQVDQQYDLYMYHVGTKTIQQLTNDRLDGSPTFHGGALEISPDGQTLVCHYLLNGRRTLEKINKKKEPIVVYAPGT